MIPGLPTPLCTVEYADEVNANVTPWKDESEEANKEAVLQWATLYIEKTYVCLFDAEEVPEAVQTACAMLGNEQLIKPLFQTVAANDAKRGIVEKMVDADGVKSQTKWDAASKPGWVDPFPQITALLVAGGYVKANGSGTFSIVRA